MSRISHLHVHSHYSLLQALPKIDAIVRAAKKHEMPAVALTDIGNMYGAIEFYKECTKKEIKPIIGIDLPLAPQSLHDKNDSAGTSAHRIVLLAENNDGYQNLIKITTVANLEGMSVGVPRGDKELLKKHSEGIIAILPAQTSESSSALRAADYKRAGEIVAEYKQIFGDNLFLGTARRPEGGALSGLADAIAKLAEKTSTPLVAAVETFYINSIDHPALEVVHKIKGDNIEDIQTPEGEMDQSFLSPEQMEEVFAEEKIALENAEKIAERCNVVLKLGTWGFPNIETAEGKTHDETLRELAYNGIEKHGLERTEELVKRVEYELEVIKIKGFAPYFLVVADLLHFAHDNGILTTIRGSVAGSLVTYLSGITNLNPLEYKLPFERFLNPERPGAPDIDMDYADNRRDEMHEYARRKYGYDHVAQIGTFGTMMARGAVRDVARAMGYPYGLGDRVSKAIPFGSQGFPMTIDYALEITPELKELYAQEEDVRTIIDMAKKIEGNARHISIHAAGVVISSRPLNEVVPVQYDPKEGTKIITQYDMWSVEDVGLLKFDFLGIRNLAILSDALKLVKKFDNVDLDIEKLPLDDQKTFEMLARGETIGLFQLNGSGMTRYLMELKPTSIHDINAMVALYRPGPMESIPSYIERKQDATKVTYLDPRLKAILDQSYGVITYQDDVLLTAITLAGYSWLEADKLRKAMGKKIPEVMQAEKEKLIKGFIEYGKLSPAKADHLWKLIEPFASYGFNKAHAASYGKVAYQTAYMKANFPGEYMTAVLTAESGDIEEVASIIAECVRMKIPVLPPDVNASFREFTFVPDPEKGDTIRFGLGSIKNFGEGIAQALIDEREAHGKFNSLGEFLSRIKDRNLNKRSLEALICSGALDALGERGIMLANMEELLAFVREQSSEASSAQTSLFGSSGPAKLELRPAPPMPQDEKLRWEKLLLGLFVSGHPLDKFKDKLEGRAMTINKILTEMGNGMIAVASGIVTEVKPLLTKGGERMLFVKIADTEKTLEVVVFPKVYQKAKDIIVVDKCIAIKGNVSHRNGTVSLLAEAVREL